jgi:membrane protease YdiL (CAAX protease family)
MNPIVSIFSRPFHLVSNGSFPRRIGDGVSVPPWSWRAAALAVAVSSAGIWGVEALRQSVLWSWQVDVLFPGLVESALGLGCLMYLGRRAGTSVAKLFGLTGTPLRKVLVSAAGLGVLEYLLLLATVSMLYGLGCKVEPESESVVSVYVRLDMVTWAPLCEELLFRGLLYTALRTRLSIAPSIVLTAAAFALSHSSCPLDKLVALFVPALLTSFWYERTRSLWPGIITHSLNNLLTVLP